MGHIRHHTIVVTSSFDERLADAHIAATFLGCSPSDITPRVTNGYRSFFIPPDGSKEGWVDSDDGDLHRARFMGWLREIQLDGAYLEWFCVAFGSDDETTRIVESAWEGGG